MREQEQIGNSGHGLGNERVAEGNPPSAPTTPRRSTSRTQDIDRYVGARISERRIMLGLTQQQLADLIGVTYQQAHKYERGINRVSAGRLFEVAQVLSVPVNYFFDALDEENDRAISPREAFRHLAAARVSDTNEQDLLLGVRGHNLSRNRQCTRASEVSSGWNVAARCRPSSTNTGLPA